MRYGLEFKEIFHVFVVDEGFCVGVVTDAGTDIAVEHGVGESEIILISFAAKSVGGIWLYL